MAITKNKSTIKKFSGGTWEVLPIADEETGPVSTDTGWLTLGYVENNTLSDNTAVEDVKDETGSVINQDVLERTVKITGTLMQSDKATIDFFKETVRDTYYTVYHYDGVNDSKYQEYVFGICQIRPQIELASGTKRIPFEITVLKNSSAITVDDGSGSNAALPSDAHAATVTIPADEYYTISETAV